MSVTVKDSGYVLESYRLRTSPESKSGLSRGKHPANGELDAGGKVSSLTAKRGDPKGTRIRNEW